MREEFTKNKTEEKKKSVGKNGYKKTKKICQEHL